MWKLVVLFLIVDKSIRLFAILPVISSIGYIHSGYTKGLRHADLHVFGVGLGVDLLLGVGVVHGHELDLHPVDGVGQEVPDGKPVAMALIVGPGASVDPLRARVPDQDGLDGHPGGEGSYFELYQGFAVSVSALGA